MRNRVCAPGKEGHLCRRAKKCFWARRRARRFKKHLKHLRKLKRARKVARKCNFKRKHFSKKKPKCPKGKTGKACRVAKRKAMKAKKCAAGKEGHHCRVAKKNVSGQEDI